MVVVAAPAAQMCAFTFRGCTVRAGAACGQSRRAVNVDIQIRRRRGAGLLVLLCLISLDFYSTGLFGGDERTLAVVRSIVLPGLPFLEWSLPAGILTVCITLFAVFAWLRWGMDWLPLAVMFVCVGIAALFMPVHHAHLADVHHRLRVLTASHEFAIVLVLFGLVSRIKQILKRIPGIGGLRRLMPEALTFPAVDVAREMVVRLYSGVEHGAVAGDLPLTSLLARARRVNAWARFRLQGDCLRLAHAPLRAMMLQAGMLNPTQTQAFVSECRQSLSGVPDSEPTWVRPLDGMLAALALDALGEDDAIERWMKVFETRFPLQHGRRAGAMHSPSMITIGTCPLWQHAASSAIARQKGWLRADDDWAHLRAKCLGAAASGGSDAESLRFIAAGRLWAKLTNDSEATEILERRTLTGDSLAEAFDSLSSCAGVSPGG